jgi:hypothetical protein
MTYKKENGWLKRSKTQPFSSGASLRTRVAEKFILLLEQQRQKDQIPTRHRQNHLRIR